VNQSEDKHWAQHLGRLQSVFERPRLGLVSDFDGTLSAFAPQPNEAVILPENANLLDRLAERVTVVALVSGRRVQDLRERFARPYLVYYGNHGLEHWHEDGPILVEAADAWTERVQSVLTVARALQLAGVIVEDKGVTASIHYRLASDPAATKARLQAQLLPLCDQYGLRLSEGPCIWEIRPPIQVDKGTIVRAIVEDYRLNGVIFLGDDVTDYAAMRALRQLSGDAEGGFRALSIGVIHPGTSPELFAVCDLTANGVHDVTHFLRWLLDHRTQLAVDKDKA